MFNPLKLVGKDKCIISLPEQSWSPVIAGINFCLIACFNGRRMVQMKYVNLFVKSPANAVYANCGSVSVIFDNSCSWLFKLARWLFTYLSLKGWLLITDPRCRMSSDVKLTLVFAKTTVVVSCLQ